MKRILIVLFALLSFPIVEFAQFREDAPIGNSPPQIATHQKTAKWPAKSFYQRKAEWQWIIDSTWGPGVSTSEKLDIFDVYANFIQAQFALFYRHNFNWDSLKTNLRYKITDSTSHGGFFQIMSQLAWSLKDEHSAAWNIEIGNTPINPGTPIFITPTWGVRDASRFGAALTVSSEGEIFVIKTIANHPLELEPGDVIIGYEGVKWMDLVNEFMNFPIPILGTGPTSEKARNHNLLMSAGFNWHLFNTIDLVKNSSGDTVHLSLEPLLQQVENIIFAEQMDIPGVPKPDYNENEQGSYGIIDNLNVGYVYIYRHLAQSEIPGHKTANQIFQEAITNSYSTEGLIIDLRFNQGGYTEIDLSSGFDILLNSETNELKHVQRCNASDLNSLCDYNPSWWPSSFTPNPQTFFQSPVAILVGPRCLSMGDFIAYRLKNFPNGKFFGKTSSGALGVLGGFDNYKGWILYTQIEESYLPNNPHQYLSGREFPVNKEVWLTKEDVVKGDDTVVKEALNWITNLAYSNNAKIDKVFTKSDVNITANVKNPNNHSLSIIAKILKDNSVVDSLDCAVTENKISKLWNVPANNEDFYTVTIITKDNEDTTVHSLPNIARFTTTGPVLLDSISIRKQFTNYAVRPFVHSAGNTATIPNASIKLICNDPWLKSSVQSIASLPDLAPSSSVGISTWISVSYTDSIFPGYFNFKVEIRSDNFTYWTDSIRVNVITGVDDDLQQPLTFKLEQNYPNPFNPTTTIGFGIMEKGNVRMSILNILGEEIRILLNEEKEPGYHSVDFNGSDLPSGVYFYRIQSGNFINAKKMILLR